MSIQLTNFYLGATRRPAVAARRYTDAHDLCEIKDNLLLDCRFDEAVSWGLQTAAAIVAVSHMCYRLGQEALALMALGFQPVLYVELRCPSCGDWRMASRKSRPGLKKRVPFTLAGQ